MWKGVFAFAMTVVAFAATPLWADENTEDGKHVVSSYQPVPKRQNEGLQCKKVKQTGSHMSRTICTTRAEREADMEASRKLLDNPHRKISGSVNKNPMTGQ